MNQSESSARIRQVAILLSSVDAATARNLLRQLPAAQARLVRQQLATLQNVTPAERESSLKMLAQLKRRVGSSSVSSTDATTSTTEANPAEVLLSHVSTSIDRVEITNSPAVVEHRSTSPQPTMASSPSNTASAADSQFLPVHGRSEYPFQNPAWTPTWQQWSGVELARLLVNERATVIAAVLVQAPAELGSAILESLPVPTATSVLAALPQLHTTDPCVLQEIYSQLHQRLADFERQSSSANAGLTKLQAILAMVSKETRRTFEHGLATAEPLLAHSLGLSMAVDVGRADSLKAVETQPNDKGREPTLAEDDRPATLPFSKESRPSDIPRSEAHVFDSFESLISLSMEDFAIVLRSVDPTTVLLAVSGASRAVQARFEGLVDPKQIKRLRERLKGLGSVALHEKISAQDKIVKSAQVLWQQRRLTSLANVGLLAAA